MAKVKNSPLDYCAYLVARAGIIGLGLGPGSWVPAKGRFIGWLYRSLDRKHYRRAIDHLTAAYPDKSSTDIEALAKGVFISLGTAIAEVCFSRRLSKEAMREYYPIHNPEIFDELLAQDKGVIGITAHLANWELAGQIVAAHGYDIHAIARPLDNPWLESFSQDIRSRTGQQVISKWGAVKASLKALKHKSLVAILMDQDGGQDAIFVDFFGQKASTIPLPAMLHEKTQSPFLVAYAKRDTNGRLSLHVKKGPTPSTADTREERIQENTQAITTQLEAAIRQAPDQWLWTHRRWKSQPPSAS